MLVWRVYFVNVDVSCYWCCRFCGNKEKINWLITHSCETGVLGRQGWDRLHCCSLIEDAFNLGFSLPSLRFMLTSWLAACWGSVHQHPKQVQTRGESLSQPRDSKTGLTEVKLHRPSGCWLLTAPNLDGCRARHQGFTTVVRVSVCPDGGGLCGVDDLVPPCSAILLFLPAYVCVCECVCVGCVI